jgi:hypothetical protein
MAGADSDFIEMVQLIAKYLVTEGDSSNNRAQPVWLNFSDDISTREKLLEHLTRKKINEAYEQDYAKMDQVKLVEMMALKIQNDFLGAVARDVFNRRRGRLFRRGCRVAQCKGSEAVMQNVVLGGVQQMLKYQR